MKRAAVILTSGGVESAALFAEAIRRYSRVYPLYVRKGFVWEKAELAHLKRFLRALGSDRLAPVTVLEAPLAAVYKPHWSLGKRPVPGFRAPDSAVYLPGRNLLLLGLGGLFCAVRKVPVLWIGVLKGNPFRDARRGFFDLMERSIREALGSAVRIQAPFLQKSKAEVIRRYRVLPWQDTFSCIRPIQQAHCGRCQKCAERRSGFRAAGVTDPTKYAK